MSGKSGKNKRPIVCSARPKQFYFKLSNLMGAFICFFSLRFAIYGGVWRKSHTLPIIIYHIENSLIKFFRAAMFKNVHPCTLFNEEIC